MKLIKACSAPYIEETFKCHSFKDMEEIKGLYSINEALKFIKQDLDAYICLHLEKGFKDIISLKCDNRVFTLEDLHLRFKMLENQPMVNVSVNTLNTGKFDTEYYSLLRMNKMLLLDKRAVIAKDEINLIEIFKNDYHLNMLMVVLAHTYGTLDSGNKKIIKIYKIKK